MQNPTFCAAAVLHNVGLSKVAILVTNLVNIKVTFFCKKLHLRYSTGFLYASTTHFADVRIVVLKFYQFRELVLYYFGQLKNDFKERVNLVFTFQ